MELCPICETPQPPGTLECPTCGRERPPPPGVDAFPRLPDLEPTLLDPKIPVPDDPVEGLEPNATALGDVPVHRLPELEQHLESPAADAPGETLTDLEPTMAEEVTFADPPPRPPTCRYCGAVGQTTGILCDRCGMKLSRPVLAAGEEAPEVDSEGRPCRACGARKFVRNRCSECGTPLPQV